MFVTQAERKLELKELSDKNQVLADENKKLRTDSSALKDQAKKDVINIIENETNTENEQIGVK